MVFHTISVISIVSSTTLINIFPCTGLDSEWKWIHTSPPMWSVAWTILRAADKRPRKVQHVSCFFFSHLLFNLILCSSLLVLSPGTIWCWGDVSCTYRKEIRKKNVFWACREHIVLVLLHLICSFMSFNLKAHFVPIDYVMLGEKRFNFDPFL